MNTSKKLNCTLLAAGCVAALATGASPASAQATTRQSVQWGPQSGSVGVNAVREGSRVRVTADIALPVGASVTGRLQLGKGLLCKAGRKKQGAEGTPTRISCTFPARYLKARRSGARSSQTPALTQEQYAKLILSVTLAMFDENHPPIVLAIPLALWSLVATSND